MYIYTFYIIAMFMTKVIQKKELTDNSFTKNLVFKQLAYFSP